MMLGDNVSVIQNCSLPSSQLKKKHNAMAYHKIQECVALGIIKLGHVTTDLNVADIFIKPLNGVKLHELRKKINNFDLLNSGECQGGIQDGPDS